MSFQENVDFAIGRHKDLMRVGERRARLADVEAARQTPKEERVVQSGGGWGKRLFAWTGRIFPRTA
jgi:hypothetical protein